MVQKILKHKKILYVTLSIIFVILVGVINFIYLSSNNHNILSNNKSKGLINDKRIAIMIETKANSGIYEMAKESRWPEGYDYNASLSKCENGTELVWDEATRSISLKADVTDKCYVYFDVMPPDVYVSASNIPKSYGALANLSCSNSDATYNQKYNRIEISAINGKNTSCNLSYTDRTNKVYLNNYITSLSGSTQGTGQVVSETASQDNSTFTVSATLNQSNYSSLSNDATYPFTWDSTNKTWTSTNHTDSATATMTFSVSSSGYYQVCYKQSSEKNYDYTKFYKDNTEVKSLKGISNTDYECSYLGNLTTSNIIKVTYRKDGSGSSGTDNVIFYFQSGTYNQKIDTVSAGIRYEGKNPNNYVWFNNELWRIIGTFGDKIKIVRNESIGKYSWDNKDKTTGAETNYGKNDWTDARLMKLLNPGYDNESVGGSLYYNAKSGTCYVNQNNATTACNFTSTGIKNDTTKNIIAEVTYNTAGYNDATLYPNEIYTYERGSTVYSGRQTTWTGKIGLMYPSDYGYASDLTKCREKINNYNASTCSQNNWIYNMGSLWLLTHDSARSDRSWSINSSGNASVNGNGKGSASNGLLVFPSLFLSSNVKIISGNGSINNPYQLGV